MLTNIKLNLQQWFNDPQPTVEIGKQDISKITSEDWISKYIESAILLNEKEEIIMDLSQALENNFVLNLKPVVNNSNNYFSIQTINTKLINKKYVNNQWIDLEPIIIPSLIFSSRQQVEIPTNKQALKFVLDNIEINQEIIRKNYASYFKALAIHSTKFSSPYKEIPGLIIDNYLNKIKKKYYPNDFLIMNISNDANTITANDFNPSLSFSVVIAKDSFANNLVVKNFIFKNDTKNLRDIYNPINVLDLLTSQEKHFGKRILTSIKKNAQYKNKIDSFFNDTNQQLIIDNVNINNPAAATFNHAIIYSNDENWSVENDNFKKILSNTQINTVNNYIIKVFNKDIILDFNASINFALDKSELNIYSGLINLDNNLFMINSVRYVLDQTITKLTFNKIHNNLINLEFPFKTYIECEKDVIEQNSLIKTAINKALWNSLASS